MDNVYRLSWGGCHQNIQAYVLDDTSMGSTLEGAIRPLLGKYSFRIWNTKPKHEKSCDFADWRGQSVDVIASFDDKGNITKLDPDAVRRGLVQPGYNKNIWACVPACLKKIALDQDPEWFKRLEKKWSM